MNGSIQALADLLKAAVFVADADGHPQYMSTQWRSLIDLKPTDSLTDRWQQAIHPDDRQSVAEQWLEATAQGRACEIQFRFQHNDGSMQDATLRATPIFDQTGHAQGYVGVCRDVREEQQKEAAFRELAHELNERVKELNCLYGISHIVEGSGGSLETVLRETVELLPRTWQYPEVASARIVLGEQKYAASDFKETRWSQAADLKVHGDVSGWVEVVYLEERPSRDEGPFLASERALLNAIAERLGHTVERLRSEKVRGEREAELRERLTHLARVGVMGEMASSIAHEVNQPLTAIATYAQAGRRLTEAGTMEPGAAIELLNRIAEDALRAGAIIHRLRDLVRKHDVSQVKCDVNELIRDVTHLATVDARLHDVTLRLALEKELPMVLADGVQIQQIVLNLVRNAVDSTVQIDATGKEVVVSTKRRDDGYVVVTVEDHGCGLPDDAEARLFQPFFTTKKGGMGLGLSISRTIAAAHGGRLWFERKSAGGTVFYLALPPAAEDHDVAK